MENKIENSSEDVPVTEDLMREHGLLNRILLIYENIIHKIEHNIDFDMDIIIQCVNIVKEFVEDYHEPLEEKYIFTFLKEKNLHVQLIDELINQHRVSKKITDKIMSYATKNDNDKLRKYLRLFIYMYRAHESREDTVIFNEFRKIAPKQLYESYSEIFEDTEKEKFGDGGYNKILNRVMDLEKQLSIYDLKVYTIVFK